MSGFQDHFSGHASSYAQSRPTYPSSLFLWLANQVTSRDVAWDAATGNGQATGAIAKHFRKVYASDASREQIAQARPVEGVEFRVESAEHPDLSDSSVDLITVAQAAHWFHLEDFFETAVRVLREGGILALWCYERCEVEVGVDEVIEDYYRSLDDDWPPERALVEDGYRSIDFPFEEITAPPLSIECDWKVDQMLSYLESWSATQRCRERLGVDPLKETRRRLPDTWGSSSRVVRWPISMRVGRQTRLAEQ